MKVLFFLIVAIAVVVGLYYMSHLGKAPAQCPEGETYARQVTGGWEPTDPTDITFGQCVPDAQITGQYNQ